MREQSNKQRNIATQALRVPGTASEDRKCCSYVDILFGHKMSTFLIKP